MKKLLSCIAIFVFCLTTLKVSAQGSGFDAPIDAGVLAPGNSFTDTENNMSGVFTDQLGEPNPEIYYKFTITVEMKVDISHCATPMDTYMHLFDSNFNEIVYNDDNGPLCASTAASMELDLLPGTYYVASEGYGINEGDITTSITAVQAANPAGSSLNNYKYPGGIIENCILSNFTDTINNTLVNGFINSYQQANNAVYYGFSISSTTNIHLSNAGSDINTYMYLLDSNFNPITSNSYGGALNAGNTGIQMTLTPGFYYVVSGGTSSTTGNIVTSINNTPIPAPTPLGANKNLPIDLGVLAPNVPVIKNFTATGCYEYAAQYDSQLGPNSNLYQIYYKFTLNSNETVTISNCGSNYGYFLNLLDGTGVHQLATASWGGSGCSNQAGIVMNLTQGTYYVTVPAFADTGTPVTTTISIATPVVVVTPPPPIGPLGPRTAVPVAPSMPSNDLDKNWVQSTSYDDDGNVIAENKKFFDNNGKPTQSQVKNETAQHVLATQTIYDFQGRPVITTQAAPINNASFAYKDKFVTNGSGNNYDYTNFDGDPSNAGSPFLKLNNPDPLSNSQKGTLGWYYSNNNTFDPFVAATSYPYVRSDFYHDGTAAKKRSAGIGEQLIMGSGHEVTSNSFPVQNELNNYLAIRNQFFPSAVIGNNPISMAGQALQSLSTDQNGLIALSITDLGGKTLMTGRADPTSNNWLSITNAITLNPAANDYEVTINTNNKSTGDIYPVSAFSVNSSSNITITKDGVTIFNDKGYKFTFDVTTDIGGGSGFTYVIKSSNPFNYSKVAYVIPLANSVINLADDVSAKLLESSSTSVQYFDLIKPQNITIGGPYQLFDMQTETEITNTFTNGSVLPAGYYRVMAKPGYDANNMLTPVTLSYTNTYSDINYNYYNQLGQLIASITPNGVKELIDAFNNNSINNISFPHFTTTYEYDLQGRLIASTSPDGGRSEYIYRKDGKIRFSQNAVQRNANSQYPTYAEKFSYTNYDDIGRPVESGEYVLPVGSPLLFQNIKTNDVILENTDPNNNLLGAGGAANLSLTGLNMSGNYTATSSITISPPFSTLTGGSFTASISSSGTTQDWVKTHYDVADNSYGLTTYIQDEGFLKGAVSWTENANSKTWYNYDDQGRVTWTIKQINGLGTKTIDYTYNGQGNIIKVDYQANNTNERFIHYYGYDADGRLINVQTSRDDTTKLQQARYYYYLHGPLKRVELGNQLQGIDYVYTPQGWLKSINHPSGDMYKDPNLDGGTNTFAPDAFGMQVEYFPDDYQRAGSNISSVNSNTRTYYNGSVTGISWESKKPQSVLSTPGIQNPAMYKYNYDNKYQLLGANWGVPDFSNNIFTTPTNSYSETVTNGYDANGNIQGLTRTNSVGATVDDKFSSYQYQTSTNKLNTVGNNTNPTAYASYTYDELGELKSMQKTGEAFTYYLKYDVTGKITGIYADALLTQLKIGYTYDESGNRISRTDNTTVTPSTNYYVYDASGNSIATYNGTTLAEMPFYGVDRLGTYTLASNNYVYELKDNVGSVRAVLNQNKKSDGTADVIAYNDYYPFGSIAQSANSTGYRYDYQGAYAEKDPVTGFNNFELRMYDGKVGRWLSTDPVGQYSSPYEGMGNNPESGVDPTGGECDGCPVPPPPDPSVVPPSSIPAGYGLPDGFSLSGVNQLKQVNIVASPKVSINNLGQNNFFTFNTLIATNDVLSYSDKVEATFSILKSAAQYSKNFSKFAPMAGSVSKVAGAVGNYVAVPLSVGMDAYALHKGEIGAGRFTYRTVGTVVGVGVGAYFGAVPALAVGGSVWIGEKSYDGATWFFGQFSTAVGQINYGLNNGWVPGR